MSSSSDTLPDRLPRSMPPAVPQQVPRLPRVFAYGGRRTAGARHRRLRVGPRDRTLDRRLAALRGRQARDVGMSTAEYAIGTVAACAFAALLYKVITSPQIFDLLTGVVSRALRVPF